MTGYMELNMEAPRVKSVFEQQLPVRVDLLRTPDGKEYKSISLPNFLAGNLHQYLNWFIEE